MQDILAVASIVSRVDASLDLHVPLTVMPSTTASATLAKSHRIIVFQLAGGPVLASRAPPLLLEEDGDSDDDDGDDWEDVVANTRRPSAPQRTIPGFRVSYATVVDAPRGLPAVYWTTNTDADADAGWRVRTADPMIFVDHPLFRTVLRPGVGFIATPHDTQHGSAEKDSVVRHGECLTAIPIGGGDTQRIPLLVADQHTQYKTRGVSAAHTSFQLPLDTPPAVEQDVPVFVYRHGATPTVKDLWAASSLSLDTASSLRAIAGVVGSGAGGVDDDFVKDLDRQAMEMRTKHAYLDARDAHLLRLKKAGRVKKRRRKALSEDSFPQWAYLSSEKRAALVEAHCKVLEEAEE